MPATVTHNLSATTPDDPAYEIRPSHWNSVHAVTVNAIGSEVSGAFNNGGGVTFGLETNGFITAAAPAGAPSPVNFSAGTTSNNLGSVVFSNSNGISWGLNGSTITGTVRTDYLTTAALSNHSHGDPTLALTNLSGTTNSNSAGLTLSLSAAQTGGLTQVHDSAFHSGTIFPQNVNQAMGSAFLDIGTIAEPASPAANVIRMYVADQNGHAVMEVKGAAGLTRRLARDSMFIARVDEAGGVVKGEVVYISGAVGANELIQKARADSDTTMPAIGIVLEDGALNAFVRVLFSGKATELNTSGFTIGDLLYVSATTAGALTTTPPPHPNLRQRIGVVTRVNTNNGEILITPHTIRGDQEGTNKNIWLVGDALAGAKSVGFRNANSGDLAWNPTAARTINLPDANGTLALGTNATTASAVASANVSGTNTSRFALEDHQHEGVFSMGVSTGGNTLNDTRVGAGRFVLEGGPNVTLSQITAAGGLNTVVFSGGAGGAGNTGSISAGTTRATLGEAVFSNSNGVSFGVNGQTVTASHNGLTSQSNQALSAANGSFAFQTASFSNANGVSFQTAAGSAIQASVAAGATATGNLGAIVGSNATYTSGTVTLTGVGGGVTVSSNTGQRIDISVAAPVAQTNQTVGRYALQNTTGQSSSSTWDARSISYAGLGIVSVGNSAGSGLVISATQSNEAFSAENASSAFQKLTFQGNQNFSFSNNAGAIRASHNLAGTSTGFNGTNISGSMTHNSSGLNLALSVAAPGGGGGLGAISAGTTQATSGTIIFSNSNGVSFGLNGQTVTGSVAGGAELELSLWRHPRGANHAHNINLTNLTALTNRPFFIPIKMEGGSIVNRSLGFMVSRAATGSDAFTCRYGLYTYVNSTQISLIGSASDSFSNTATASNSGVRAMWLTELGTGGNASTMTRGVYCLGMWFSAAATASMNYNIRGNSTVAIAGQLFPGDNQYSTLASQHIIPFWGRRSATATGLDVSYAASDIQGLITAQIDPALTIRNWSV